MLSITQQRVHVRFVHARDEYDKAWQPVWLSPSVLHKSPSSDIETAAVCCALCDQQLNSQTCANCDIDWGVDPEMPSLVACAGVPMPTQDMVLDLYMGDYERSDSYSALKPYKMRSIMQHALVARRPPPARSEPHGTF